MGPTRKKRKREARNPFLKKNDGHSKKRGAKGKISVNLKEKSHQSTSKKPTESLADPEALGKDGTPFTPPVGPPCFAAAQRKMSGLRAKLSKEKKTK